VYVHKKEIECVLLRVRYSYREFVCMCVWKRLRLTRIWDISSSRLETRQDYIDFHRQVHRPNYVFGFDLSVIVQIVITKNKYDYDLGQVQGNPITRLHPSVHYLDIMSKSVGARFRCMSSRTLDLWFDDGGEGIPQGNNTA